MHPKYYMQATGPDAFVASVRALTLLLAVMLFGLAGYVFDVARADAPGREFGLRSDATSPGLEISGPGNAMARRVEIRHGAAANDAAPILSVVLQPVSARDGATPGVELLPDGRTVVVHYEGPPPVAH